MSAVLGVSVGTSAVRMVTLPRPGTHTGVAGFGNQAVEVVSGPAPDVAAQSIGVLLEHEQHTGIGVTGVAHGTAVAPDSIHDAMARQHLGNYQLVSEADAVVTLLESAGQLAPTDTTLVCYDLGSSGVTVSVVDRQSRTVLSEQRSDVVGGDRFDTLIAEQQIRERGLARPDDTWAAAEFTARCRDAKEQLSASGAAAVPGDAGLILLNRERFEALIRVPVEASARLARDVVTASGRIPDVLVLLGGGARIPLVQGVLQNWLGLRAILPPEPELVVAQGAALIATTLAPAVAPADSIAAQPESFEFPHPDGRRGPSRRQLILAGSVAAGLVAIVGVGLVLGGNGGGATPVETGENAVAEVTAPPSTTKPATTTPAPTTTTAAPASDEPSADSAREDVADAPQPAPAPSPRYLNLPDPIRIEVPPNIQLPPGMTR